MTSRYLPKFLMLCLVGLNLGGLAAQPANPGAVAPAVPGQPDWAAEAGRWEARALDPAVVATERGRFYYNAATAWLEAAQAGPAALGETNSQPSAHDAGSATVSPDFDKILAFLQRASALAPLLSDKVAHNWEITRAMQRQSQEQKKQQDHNKQDQQKSGQNKDQQSGQQQPGQGRDQKSGQQSGQDGQSQKGNGSDLASEINKLKQRQSRQNTQDASASSAAGQEQLAKDTKTAQAKADKESTRQNLAQAQQAMQQAAEALKKGDQDKAGKQQQAALAALDKAQKAEQGTQSEDQTLRDLSQKEKEYRQLKALLRPQVPEQVEKNW